MFVAVKICISGDRCDGFKTLSVESSVRPRSIPQVTR